MKCKSTCKNSKYNAIPTKEKISTLKVKISQLLLLHEKKPVEQCPYTYL